MFWRCRVLSLLNWYAVVLEIRDCFAGFTGVAMNCQQLERQDCFLDMLQHLAPVVQGL